MAVWDRNGSSAMSMSDDLPRTLRREREARERAGIGGLPHTASAPVATAYIPEATQHDGIAMSGGTVTDVRIPFFRLMMISIKLVLAAIPALILLGVLLWLAGHLLMTFFPWLVKLQILIRVP